MRRAALLAMTVCACALAAAGPASAHSLVRPSGHLISYVSADAASADTVEVEVAGDRIVFRDETVDGGIDPGACAPGDVDRAGYIVQVRCPLDGVRRVRIDLGEREDQATVTLPVATTVLGGPGADSVASGAGRDDLGGGEGNDLIDGGAGDDAISGDAGADTLTGGAGSDRIRSRDGEIDSVSCGEGSDTVDADTLDRVAGDCESVARIDVPAPGGRLDDGRPPRVEVGAPTLQRLGTAHRVRVYATSSERGTVSASGALVAGGLALPVKSIPRKRVRVGGGGVVLTYTLRGRHRRLAERVLRRGGPVVARLVVVATDLAGLSSRRSAPPIGLVGARVHARAAHPEPGDRDGDHVRDEADNCPTVGNGSQVNTDAGLPGGDPHGDACDGDDDADGVPDASDNCRVDANPGQEPHPQYPAYGAACSPVDTDGDGFVTEDDNCDVVPNRDQADTDGDDVGDACDGDDDDDGFRDAADSCPLVYGDQSDRDGDGVGSVCDLDEPLVGAPDGRRPALRVGVARRHLLAAVRAGLVVRVRCSEACATTVELAVDRGLGRRLGLGRTAVLGSGSAQLQAAGVTYVFVRFDRRARPGLFRRRAVRATLTAVAVDRGGNRRRAARKLTLARR